MTNLEPPVGNWLKTAKINEFRYEEKNMFYLFFYIYIYQAIL